MHQKLSTIVKPGDKYAAEMKEEVGDAANCGTLDDTMKTIAASIDTGQAQLAWAEGYRYAISRLLTRDGDFTTMLSHTVEFLGKLHLEQSLGIR